jgi:hypothetical protein
MHYKSWLVVGVKKNEIEVVEQAIGIGNSMFVCKTKNKELSGLLLRAINSSIFIPEVPNVFAWVPLFHSSMGEKCSGRRK